jgi:CCR4-NOT transcription complex subunit 4
LVYVVGLTLTVAKEKVKFKNKFKFLKNNFGKYGKISKVVINKSNLSSSKTVDNLRTPTVSAYVTYIKRGDAAEAIAAVDGTWLDSKLLRYQKK